MCVKENWCKENAETPPKKKKKNGLYF